MGSKVVKPQAVKSTSSIQTQQTKYEGRKRDANLNYFWEDLYLEAEKYTKSLSLKHRYRLDPNPNLRNGAPVALKFLKALKNVGLHPENVDLSKILENGVFGWHGTPTADNVSSIAYNNLDPNRRKRQANGPGEYCNFVPDTAMISNWGDTNTLFLFFILKVQPYYNNHLKNLHIVNNPIKGDEIYMVPILVATFHDKPPLSLIPVDCLALAANDLNKIGFKGHLIEELKSNPRERREVALKNFFLRMENSRYSPPKNKNSIDFCCKNSNLMRVVKESGICPEITSVTEESDMLDLIKQIENITGYDLLTENESIVTVLKLASSKIDQSTILQESPQKVENCIKLDLATAHRVSLDNINIRKIVPGCYEIFFSITENRKVKTLGNLDFNSLSKLLDDKDFKISQKELLPDRSSAFKLFRNYYKPLIINTNSKYSQLCNNFVRYLPLLATLEAQVFAKGNQIGVLEVFGTPDQRASVLRTFTDVESLLLNLDILDKIIICQQSEYLSQNSVIKSFWDKLFNEAIKFVLNSAIFKKPIKLQYNTLRINPNLKRGAPASLKFLKALKINNLDPEIVEFSKILEKGIFGWHGTKTAENFASIAYENLNPKLRKNNVFGPGEYCAKNPHYSIDEGYWGNTSSLFLFFILKISNIYKFETHHVVNNPIQSEEMYMVPILVATFNDQIPLNLIPIDIKYQYEFIWEWQDDDGWKHYGEGQPIEQRTQYLIQEMYESTLKERQAIFTLSLVRLKDKQIDTYEIDLQKMIQTNKRTNHQRQIRKIRK